jgi:hypothetical protein
MIVENTIFTTTLFLLIAKHVRVGIWNVPLHSRSYDALKKKTEIPNKYHLYSMF